MLDLREKLNAHILVGDVIEGVRRRVSVKDPNARSQRFEV